MLKLFLIFAFQNSLAIFLIRENEFYSLFHLAIKLSNWFEFEKIKKGYISSTRLLYSRITSSIDLSCNTFSRMSPSPPLYDWCVHMVSEGQPKCNQTPTQIGLPLIESKQTVFQMSKGFLEANLKLKTAKKSASPPFSPKVDSNPISSVTGNIDASPTRPRSVSLKTMLVDPVVKKQPSISSQVCLLSEIEVTQGTKNNKYILFNLTLLYIF